VVEAESCSSVATGIANRTFCWPHGTDRCSGPCATGYQCYHPPYRVLTGPDDGGQRRRWRSRYRPQFPSGRQTGALRLPYDYWPGGLRAPSSGVSGRRAIRCRKSRNGSHGLRRPSPQYGRRSAAGIGVGHIGIELSTRAARVGVDPLRLWHTLGAWPAYASLVVMERCRRFGSRLPCEVWSAFPYV
jgi:hypothetical protein